MTAREPDDSNLVYAHLSEDPLELVQAMAAVENERCGAVVSFAGVVRNHDGGKAVTALSYSAHPSAQQVLHQLAERAASKNPEVLIWVAHRVGDLTIGEAALVCVVAAAHRGQAFAVCSELVDAVKAEVPIWKEQHFADGSIEWVGA